MRKKSVFIIGGPTASGKSALALRLAEFVNGSIVNGDSLQIYKDLQILSARPSKDEMKDIPHYLFGYVDAWTVGSITDWLQEIEKVVPQLDYPIVVGGTGMYLDALVNGVSPIPDIDPEIRKKVRKMPIEKVRSLVKDCSFFDPQRLKRALEVQLSTGKSLNYFYKLPKKKVLDVEFKLIHVLPERERVYENCKNRFYQMIEAGAIDEVVHLNEINATGGLLKAIGVKEIQHYLQKLITKDQMIEQAITATRQYAKRQMTWFRHHGQPKYVISDVKKIKISDITK